MQDSNLEFSELEISIRQNSIDRRDEDSKSSLEATTSNQYQN